MVNQKEELLSQSVETEPQIKHLSKANEILPKSASKQETPHYVIEGQYLSLHKMEGSYPIVKEKLQVNRSVSSKKGTLLPPPSKDQVKYKHLSSLISEKDLVYKKYKANVYVAFNIVRCDPNTFQKGTTYQQKYVQGSQVDVNRGRSCKRGDEYVEDKFIPKVIKSIGLPIESNLSSSIDRKDDALINNIPNTSSYQNISTNIQIEPLNQEIKAQSTSPHREKESNFEDEISFSSDFECGNLSYAFKGDSNRDFILVLQNDINTAGFTQWFFFKVENKNNVGDMTFKIINCSKKKSLFQFGMKVLAHSQIERKEKKKGWHRAGKSISYFTNNYINPSKKGKDGSKIFYNTLEFTYSFKHQNDEVFFAYNYPYSYTELQRYLDGLESDNFANRFLKRRALCRTLADNKVELLTITNPRPISEKKKNQKKKHIIVISARVHPGETVSSFMVKGVIDFLLSSHPEAHMLRDHFIFKIIPMINPDGVVHGNYRCSLSGKDLNRQWKKPNKVLHREIFNLKNLILDSSDLVLFCDLHGHSMKKNIFVYGCHDYQQPSACRELPYILSKLYEPFSFQDCNFNMNAQKQGTARVALFRHLRIPNIFTLESSFCGPSYDNVHFQPADLERMGEYLCKALVIYFHPIMIENIETQETETEQSSNRETNSTELKESNTFHQISNQLNDVKSKRQQFLSELIQNDNLLQMGMEDSDGSDSAQSEDEYFEKACSNSIPMPSIITPKQSNLQSKRDSNSLPPLKLKKSNKTEIFQVDGQLLKSNQDQLSPFSIQYPKQSVIIQAKDIPLERCPSIQQNPSVSPYMFSYSPKSKIQVSGSSKIHSKIFPQNAIIIRKALAHKRSSLYEKNSSNMSDKSMCLRSQEVEIDQKMEIVRVKNIHQDNERLSRNQLSHMTPKKVRNVVNTNSIQIQPHCTNNTPSPEINRKKEYSLDMGNIVINPKNKKFSFPQPIYSIQQSCPHPPREGSLPPIRSSKGFNQPGNSFQFDQLPSTLIDSVDDFYGYQQNKNIQKEFESGPLKIANSFSEASEKESQPSKQLFSQNNNMAIEKDFNRYRLKNILMNDIRLQENPMSPLGSAQQKLLNSLDIHQEGTQYKNNAPEILKRFFLPQKIQFNQKRVTMSMQSK